MPAPSVSNPLIRLTKMFSSLVCFRSVPGLEESPVLGSPRLVASTIMLSALLSCVAVHQVHAQNNAPIFNWQGEVQVSTSTLTIQEGETISYAIRLSEQPSADGWWVRIHVDGVVYTDGRLDEKGVRWVPSVGWEFNREGSSGPTQWRTVHITAFQDDDDDRDEFVTITHEVWDENSNCPPSLHGVAPVEVQVTDDESASTGVALSVNPMTVSEGAGGTPVTVRAALNGAARLGSTPVKVAVGRTGDSATEGTDYETVDDLTVTIPAGLTSATERFTLTPTDVVVVESDKTVTVSGTTTVSGITTINPATLTITDDETPNNPPTGQPRITGTARVGQTLTAVTTDIQDADGLGDFAYQWKADGTNIAGAIDSSYTLTNNEVGKRITVTVSFTDGIGTEKTVTSQPTAAVKDAVTPPPPALTVAFDPASYSTTEGGDPVTVRVTLNRTSDQDVTIPITVMPQGATEADDYTVSGLTDGTLSFAPGDLSKTFMIVANEDTDSDDETIELGFGTLPEGVSKGEMATATLTITDDVPPDTIELRVSFARAEHTVAEGGEPASINVNISPAADRRVEVSLVGTPQGGATSQDYDGVPASIVFEVGATVVTLQVAALADQENDPGESLVLGFGDLPEAVRAGDPSETTVKFTQQRSAEQFSASLKIMLAVVARSVAESAQTAIQSRFQRKRQLMRAKQSARGPNAGGSLSAGQAGSNGSGLSRTGALNHIPEADRFGFAPPRLAEGTGPSLGSVRSGSLHNALVPDYGIAPTRATGTIHSKGPPRSTHRWWLTSSPG